MITEWRYFVAEISARGWRAFAYGPEFWLAFPAVLGAIFYAVIFPQWRRAGSGKNGATRRKKKKRKDGC